MRVRLVTDTGNVVFKDLRDANDIICKNDSDPVLVNRASAYVDCLAALANDQWQDILKLEKRKNFLRYAALGGFAVCDLLFLGGILGGVFPAVANSIIASGVFSFSTLLLGVWQEKKQEKLINQRHFINDIVSEVGIRLKVIKSRLATMAPKEVEPPILLQVRALREEIKAAMQRNKQLKMRDIPAPQEPHKKPGV